MSHGHTAPPFPGGEGALLTQAHQLGRGDPGSAAGTQARSRADAALRAEGLAPHAGLQARAGDWKPRRGQAAACRQGGRGPWVAEGAGAEATDATLRVWLGAVGLPGRLL